MTNSTQATPAPTVEEIQTALRNCHRQINLLQNYGVARFRDDWGPSGAEPYIKLPRDEIDQILNADLGAALLTPVNQR